MKLYHNHSQGVLSEQKEWKACLVFLDFSIISLPLLLLSMGIPAGVAVATVGVPVTLLGNGLADTCFHQSVLLPVAEEKILLEMLSTFFYLE